MAFLSELKPDMAIGDSVVGNMTKKGASANKHGFYGCSVRIDGEFYYVGLGTKQAPPDYAGQDVKITMTKDGKYPSYSVAAANVGDHLEPLEDDSWLDNGMEEPLSEASHRRNEQSNKVLSKAFIPAHRTMCLSYAKDIACAFKGDFTDSVILDGILDLADKMVDWVEGKEDMRKTYLNVITKTIDKYDAIKLAEWEKDMLDLLGIEDQMAEYNREGRDSWLAERTDEELKKIEVQISTGGF